jgi:TetR/AcrR family transcriptional repressor of nem operon
MSNTLSSDKANEILETARVLMMDRGYNGFSFRDVASQVGIKSASVHYHYPTKADLAEAAAKSYRKAFSAALDGLSDTNAPNLLHAYGSLFVASLREQGGLCLGGMLAADAKTLPAQVQSEVVQFLDEQHRWIATVLCDGQNDGTIRSDIDADGFSKVFVSSLEGAMMVSRGIKQHQDLEASLELLIQLVRA